MKIGGKVALVTGAGRGIGLAVARVLAAKGAKVALLARSEEEIGREAERIVQEGGEALAVPCDQRDPEATAEAIERVRERFGALHILVNNAGIGRFAPVAEMDPADWDTVLRTNLDGVFYITHAALPLLFDSAPGFVVNIGSLAGKGGFEKGAAYCASKAGLIGFTESLMLEIRPKGVRAAIVMPGSVDTTFRVTQIGKPPWQLKDSDIAGAVLGILETDDSSHISRVEIRPAIS